MNGNRNAAMWLGITGVAAGVIGVIAAVMGDLRVGTIVADQSRELGYGIWVVAVGLIIVGIGAAVTPYRPLAAAGLMFVGVLGILVGQWSEMSQWAVDLRTSGTGGIVSYVDSSGLTRMPGFWDVLLGSVTMLGYAGTFVLGTVGAIIAAFAPPAEATELRTSMRPASL